MEPARIFPAWLRRSTAGSEMNATGSTHGWGRTLGYVAGIALAYVLLAKLGSMFAIPPGNVTLLWFTSGLPLAAALWLGGGGWPGSRWAAWRSMPGPCRAAPCRRWCWVVPWPRHWDRRYRPWSPPSSPAGWRRSWSRPIRWAASSRPSLPRHLPARSPLRRGLPRCTWPAWCRDQSGPRPGWCGDWGTGWE